ncbi:hypothetical protein HHI36_002516 [Cryptolaemus montrouzieri]|uniref:Uncharacterized protein n=1 Tax=Cryptolaemus montrouzieri TaxID=559131 RepID=A0ABD2PC95_9CUCU
MDEDDLNCLKLHLGNRFKNSDSSDSAEDTETDEEYNLLKPIPIPADIIRERAIYRPPTPEENEAISNASSVEVQTITEELQLTSIDEEKQVFDGGHIFSTHLDMAKELIVDQQAINIHKDKLSPIFIQTLEKFKMKVENFKISMKIFNSKQFKSYLMDLKESGNLALEDKICIFDILLSNWFAFVMSECLMIIRISFEFGNDKLLIMYQAVGLIRGFGNIQEIEEKISKRNLKTLDELKDFNIGTLANIQMSNEEILKSLIPLQPKTKVPQKKNLKNMVEQEESFDECSQNRTIDMNIKEPLKVPDFIKPEQNAVMKGAIVSSATIEYSIPQTTASDEIQMNFDGQKIVLYHLGMAKDLVTIQQKIHYLHEKLPTNFVKILEKFKIEVEKFEKSMQIFSTENFMAMCTDLSLENVVALFENNIFSLEVLISIFMLLWFLNVYT